MAGSYVSQLVRGTIGPAEFVTKSAAWLKTQGIFKGDAVNWLIEGLERLLIAKGVPGFLAEVITNEIKEALGINPATPPTPPG